MICGMGNVEKSSARWKLCRHIENSVGQSWLPKMGVHARPRKSLRQSLLCSPHCPLGHQVPVLSSPVLAAGMHHAKLNWLYSSPRHVKHLNP